MNPEPGMKMMADIIEANARASQSMTNRLMVSAHEDVITWTSRLMETYDVMDEAVRSGNPFHVVKALSVFAHLADLAHQAREHHQEQKAKWEEA